MSDPHDDITDVFARFKQAVESEDARAYEALCVHDELPQTELFLENARKMKAAGLTLRIKGIEQEGDVAEVSFDVLEGKQVIDEGQVTLTSEADGWRVRSL